MFTLRVCVESRLLIALTAAAIAGTFGLHAFPINADEPFIAAISQQRPDVMSLIGYGYAILWFSTPFHVVSLLLSVCAIVLYRKQPQLRFRPLPPYPRPSSRPTPSIVLGESHHPTMAGRAAEPQWLTVPQRGLYTGIMIVGAIGTGKTSACMYPYVDQLVGWRSQDPQRKVGGLVMEVKGDFCQQVRRMLSDAGRGD